jgi:ATP-dependent DNA helicase DinG
MDAALDALRPKLPFRILGQRDLPKPELIKQFQSDPSVCLFATAGLFQGIDIPGETLSLVTIDRLPFPRPDDPLLDARREAAGADAFRLVDLPRATTMLAQAAGRLIRSVHDKGVVAIFDPRLNKANYRWEVVNALPPMKRTRHRAEAEAFLRQLAAVTAAGPQ